MTSATAAITSARELRPEVGLSAARREPAAYLKGGVVYRYRSSADVDRPPGERCFLACRFWLADNYILQGRCATARAVRAAAFAGERFRPPRRGVRASTSRSDEHCIPVVGAGLRASVAIWIASSLCFGFYVQNFANYNQTYGSMHVLALIMNIIDATLAALIGIAVARWAPQARSLRIWLPCDTIRPRIRSRWRMRATSSSMRPAHR